MNLAIQTLKTKQEESKTLKKPSLAKIIEKSNYLNKIFKEIRQKIVKDNPIKMIHRYQTKNCAVADNILFLNKKFAVLISKIIKLIQDICNK